MLQNSIITKNPLGNDKAVVLEVSADANNNTITMNAQETLPAILRMLDPTKLAKDCVL